MAVMTAEERRVLGYLAAARRAVTLDELAEACLPGSPEELVMRVVDELEWLGRVTVYRALCKAEPRALNPGDVFLWKTEGKPWVFNLATQEGYWRSRATYEAVEAALRRMRELADAEGVTSVAMPRVGVGYGGLSWRKVRAVIERVFDDWPGRLVVYEEFVPSGSDGQAESGS
jgi:O-acetyl-ADP-ribose deacetylase (regulator of RNase III)